MAKTKTPQKPTKEEERKWEEYESLMREHGWEPRPKDQWLTYYREVKARLANEGRRVD